MISLLRASVATVLYCCVELVFLSPIRSSVPSHDLFLMSATHSADIFKSSIQRWDIDDALKQQVGGNMNGEILFTAALQLDEAAESQWNSGLGSLEIHVKTTMVTGVARNDHEQSNLEVYSLSCVFMSVSGADGKFNVSELLRQNAAHLA